MSKTARFVRFSRVVNHAGAPVEHLVLAKPEADNKLARARRENRVMTVHQPAVGTKADHGEVGFSPGKLRQYLIFPKSLRAFADSTVVGVKYELMDRSGSRAEETAAKPPRPVKARPAKGPMAKPESRAPRPRRVAKSAVKRSKAAAETAENKVIAFPRAALREKNVQAESEEVGELKQQVRKALQALEDGKQVVAFRVLQKILED